MQNQACHMKMIASNGTKKLKVSSHDTSAKTTDVVCHTNEENGLI